MFIIRLRAFKNLFNAYGVDGLSCISVRWTGFSGQPPSLTSEAGYRPLKGLPPMSKRRTHSSEFKTRIAMEAISGRKPIQ